jgi:hypothetical protein
VTNSEGLFEVPSLVPGEYSLLVSISGFADQTRDIVLEVGQHMGLDFVLRLGESHETVTVAASAENLKTQDASIGEVVEPKSIQDLPLNGRMLIDLALTVPDAHIGMGAQTGETSPLYWRPGQRSAITIGGNRPDANYYLLDGVTNIDPTFNTMNLSLSPDAVQEVQVQTGSYSAELGGGGQVNIVTRQGGGVQRRHLPVRLLRGAVLEAGECESRFMVRNRAAAAEVSIRGEQDSSAFRVPGVRIPVDLPRRVP